MRENGDNRNSPGNWNTWRVDWIGLGGGLDKWDHNNGEGWKEVACGPLCVGVDGIPWKSFGG